MPSAANSKVLRYLSPCKNRLERLLWRFWAGAGAENAVFCRFELDPELHCGGRFFWSVWERSCAGGPVGLVRSGMRGGAKTGWPHPRLQPQRPPQAHDSCKRMTIAGADRSWEPRMCAVCRPVCLGVRRLCSCVLACSWSHKHAASAELSLLGAGWWLYGLRVYALS